MESPPRSSPRSLLRTLEVTGLGYLGVVVVAVLIWSTPQRLQAVIVGGVIALANFRLWEWFGEGLLAKQPRRQRQVATQMLVKISVPFVMIALVLWGFKIDGLGFLLGLSTIVASVFVYALYRAMNIWRQTQ